MQPSDGDIIDRFIDGLKSAARKHVEEMLPEDGGLSQKLFSIKLSTLNKILMLKILKQGQLNHIAQAGPVRAPRQNLKLKPQTFKRPGPRLLAPPPPRIPQQPAYPAWQAKNPRIDKATWNQRISANLCGYCSQANHRSWECSDRNHDSRIAQNFR